MPPTDISHTARERKIKAWQAPAWQCLVIRFLNRQQSGRRSLLTGRLDAGAALFSPVRSYSSSPSELNGNFGAFTIGPNDLDSSREYFVIPHIAYSWELSPDSAFAFAFYGRGGMNTEWDGGTATFDPTGQGGPPGTFDGTFGAALVGQGCNGRR